MRGYGVLEPDMSQGAPSLSVLLVAADSGPSLHDCVTSVLACTRVREVLLSDNASADGVPQAIAQAYQHEPRLRVLYNHANLGFGPAVNRAARVATGDTLLVLNPDCLLDESSLHGLLEVLAAHPEAGVVGAVVCAADGTPDPASYRRDPLLHRALHSFFGGRGETVNIAGALPTVPVEAEQVSGAVLLMRRQIFEAIGGFDEAYFLHCEDLDLCRRLRDAGYPVWLAGNVHVPHGKGGSSRHRPVFVSRWKHRGMWRWFRKFDPAARQPLIAAVVWLGIWTHFVVQLPRLWWRLRRHRHARAPVA